MPEATAACAIAMGHGHALFDTSIGTCGIAWGPGGIVAVQLPEADAHAMQSRLLRNVSPHCAGTAQPPPAVRNAIDGIQALLTGQPRDLCEVPLDLSGVGQAVEAVPVSLRVTG